MRNRLVVAMVVASMAAVLSTPAQAATRVTCTLAPEVRDVTVTQGVGAYPTLTRGKEALVRAYLSLPSCAGSTSSITLTGARLTVTPGPGAAVTVGAYTPAAGAPAPALPPYTSAAAVDAMSDPKFVIPASVLTPAATTARFTATLGLSLTYSAKTSSTATAVTGTLTPAATTAVVERKTNALRILVVPMGDPTLLYANQFTAVDRSTTENGLRALARLLPVPDGTGDLSGATGGVRYSITPTVADITPFRSPLTTGRFCGTSANFDGIKAVLAQFLQSWNTANVNATADRVVGVVSGSLSDGGSSGCAEGMAGVSSSVAWVRAVAGTDTAPSLTGSLMAMEVGHTLGLVPRVRDDDFSPYHSTATEADGPSPNRAYNVPLRTFIAADRTAMTLRTGWNDTTTLFERDDWSYLLCALGGATTTDCTTSSTVGTANGVGGDPTFVLSGTTDGTEGGTSVLESYFATGAPRAAVDPVSTYRLVQRNPNGILRNDGVLVSSESSAHDNAVDTGATTAATPRLLFSPAVPFDTGANRIELWRGTPDAAGSVLLYHRNRGQGNPAVQTAQVPPSGGGGGGAVVERMSVGTNADGVDVQSGQNSSGGAMSADGRFVVFDTAERLVGADTNLLDDVYRRDTVTGLTQLVSFAAGNSGLAGNGASNVPDISADGRYVAFTSDATDLVSTDSNGVRDVFVTDMNGPSTVRASVASDGTQQDGLAFQGVRLSANGRYVAFASQAANLGRPVNVTADQVYVRDLVGGGVTDWVSRGVRGNENQSFAQIPIGVSNDGNRVAFSTYNQLVPEDQGSNFNFDIYVRDRAAANTYQVTVTDGGVQASCVGQVACPAGNGRLSADGNKLAFDSSAPNMVSGDTNGVRDLFYRDITNLSALAAPAPAGGLTRAVDAIDISQPTQESILTGASASLDYLAFTSSDDAAFRSPPNQHTDAYVLQAGTGVALSSAGGIESISNGDSTSADVSDNGRYVSFASSAFNLVSGDTNGATDVFRWNRDGGGAPPPTGTAPLQVTATADVPADLRLDLYYTCPNRDAFPVAVALMPDAVSGGVATWQTNVDTSLACAGGVLSVVANDGFARSLPQSVTGGVPDAGNHAPSGAIYGPAPGSTVLQYARITLDGTGKDPEQGQLGDASLTWYLTPPGGPEGPGGTGTHLDLAPPLPGGWTPGEWRVRLVTTDQLGRKNEQVRLFTVVGDADNDGVPTAQDKVSCAADAASADNDPTSAWTDPDGDLLTTSDEIALGQDPCAAPTPALKGTISYSPNPVPVSSGSPVTAYLAVPDRLETDVIPTTVRIVSIDGLPVTGNQFRALSYTATSTLGTVKFDRAALTSFIVARFGYGKSVPVVVRALGGSGWTVDAGSNLSVKK